jgi:hypothetical protein
MNADILFWIVFPVAAGACTLGLIAYDRRKHRAHASEQLHSSPPPEAMPRVLFA